MDTTFEYLEKEDLLSSVLRYGLYMGAVFQLICIFACIFLPNSTPGGAPGFESGEFSPDHSSSQNTPKRPHFRVRKQDKKKRR